MSIIHHTKRQLKNFNKRGQLISTLMRTFYEASAAEEEDRRRCHGHGDSAEDTRPAGLQWRRLFEERN
jgi:hypothetical protein